MESKAWDQSWERIYSEEARRSEISVRRQGKNNGEPRESGSIESQTVEVEDANREHVRDELEGGMHRACRWSWQERWDDN